MRQFAIALLAAGMAARVTLAQAPRAVDVSGVPSCATCRIDLEKIATIGNASDSGLMAPTGGIARGPNGTYVAASITQDQLLVFDSAGRLRHVVGRRGSGPGEFSGHGPLQVAGVGRGDSLYVLDGRTISVFSPAFVFGRSFTLPMEGWRAFVPLPNGACMVAARTDESSSGSLDLLHLIGPFGTVDRSFGRAQPADNCGACLFRSLRLSRDASHVLVTHVNRYVIEQFDIRGAMTLVVTVKDSPWHRAWSQPARAFVEPPEPTISSVGDLGNGRLWIIGAMTTSDWRPSVDPPGRTGSAGLQAIASDVAQFFSRNRATVIELVDVERRTVMASRRLDGLSYFLIDHDLVAQQKEDADGVITFDMFRLKLREP
jgi:hypothetical protein